MPVMVCVEVDEDIEDERVVTVVVGTEDRDIALARDSGRTVLVYDESMERVAPSEPGCGCGDLGGGWPGLAGAV
jgi:hypothetical protein